MQTEGYDLIVIGGGGAANELATRAHRDFGARVVVIEQGRWGGICSTTACKPTKQYLSAAELLHHLRVAPELGIDLAVSPIDLVRLRARKDAKVGSDVKRRQRFADKGFDLIDGHARLLDGGTVEVAGRVLTAPRIGIATGSLQAVPPVEGIGDIPWIDHAGALELDRVPASLAVLGAGAVGLELAQVFARFGSAVTLVQRPDRIADRVDRDLSAALHASLEAEGITVHVGTTPTRARRVDGGVELTLVAREGGAPVATIVVETVLVASGRRPNVDGLGLDAAGVAHGPRGIEVDGHMRTSVEGIWAVGDVTATMQLTPVGDYQARIAVEDMFAGPSREARYDLVPTAIFTDPELASVGLSEAAAREAGMDVGTATTPLGNIMRPTFTTPDGERAHGVLKLVYERGTRRLLGVHAVSPAAGDLIQGYTVALAAGARLDELALGHYAFPTFAEGLHYAALAAYECETGLRAGTPDEGPPVSTRMAP